MRVNVKESTLATRVLHHSCFETLNSDTRPSMRAKLYNFPSLQCFLPRTRLESLDLNNETKPATQSSLSETTEGPSHNC